MADTFAELIKQTRQELNLTQEEVATRLDVSSSYVVLLEQGKRKPSLNSIPQWATALNLDPRRLISLALQARAPMVFNLLPPISYFTQSFTDKHLSNDGSIVSGAGEIKVGTDINEINGVYVGTVVGINVIGEWCALKIDPSLTKGLQVFPTLSYEFWLQYRWEGRASEYFNTEE